MVGSRAQAEAEGSLRPSVGNLSCLCTRQGGLKPDVAGAQRGDARLSEPGTGDRDAAPDLAVTLNAGGRKGLSGELYRLRDGAPK